MWIPAKQVSPTNPLLHSCFSKHKNIKFKNPQNSARESRNRPSVPQSLALVVRYSRWIWVCINEKRIHCSSVHPPQTKAWVWAFVFLASTLPAPITPIAQRVSLVALEEAAVGWFISARHFWASRVAWLVDNGQHRGGNFFRESRDCSVGWWFHRLFLVVHGIAFSKCVMHKEGMDRERRNTRLHDSSIINSLLWPRKVTIKFPEFIGGPKPPK